MKAIILAAGRGSRMQDMTDDRPKCLLQLHDKSLLDRGIESLKAAGITEIAIVTGYKREMLADRATTEFHNARWMETNMVSSLACAAEWLQSAPCIVAYSDIFYEPSAVASLMAHSADLAVTYDPHWLELWTNRFGDPLLDAETFRLNGDGTLAEIGNKPESLDEIEGQYMGLLRFTPRAWAEVERLRSSLPEQTRDAIHMTGTLNKLIGFGRISIAAVPYTEPWGEVDFADDLSFYHQR